MCIRDSPHVAGQLDELRKQKSIKFDEELKLKELITFITIMETEQGYVLTAPVSLNGKHVSLSMFLTQFQQSTMKSINYIHGESSNAGRSAAPPTNNYSNYNLNNLRNLSPYYENTSQFRDNRNRSFDRNNSNNHNFSRSSYSSNDYATIDTPTVSPYDKHQPASTGTPDTYKP